MFSIAPSAPAPTNIYSLYEYGVFPGYTDTTGRTTVAPFSLAGTDACFPFWGQSIDANHGVSNYTPTNTTSVLEVNPYSGTIYQLKDPVLGCSGTAGSFLGRLGDKLINAGIFTKVIFIPVAIGGTSIDQWAPSGLHHHRLRSAVLRARSLGWTITAILGNTGNSDHAIGSSWGSYYSQVRSSMVGYGYSGKWFVSKNTRDGSAANDATVQAQQTGAVDNVTVFAGPDYESLTGGTNRQAGNEPHLTDTGNDSLATLWKTALDAVF